MAGIGGQAYKNSYLNPRHFRHVPIASLKALEALEITARKYGFDRIELAFPPAPNGSVGDLNGAVGKKVDQMVDDFELVTVHLPMVPIDTPEGLAEIMAGLQFAKTHGILQAVVHPSEGRKRWPYALPYYGSNDSFQIKQNGVKNLKSLMSAAMKAGIVIGVENMASGAPWGRDIKEFSLLFKKKENSLVVGACLDTAHVLNIGKDLTKETKSNLGNIIEVHLNDTKVKHGPDKHCGLGQGLGKESLPLAVNALEEAKFPGIVCIEVQNAKEVEASWKWLQDHGLA